ncbi:MAG: hypothetical protein A3C08_02330 [Candidatus Taylorbacteria bacterium RIFCSPHIGHO2_02_FULL_47_18]|nr:MAG: hypothetical protein A3C08_02330 [Candidatus Taylorbacteria bacterium RIFCSPHIGHO2_02_FULL_47_18]OHA40979.1 MAG: hypothetical protein A3J31_02405 [Candidatus Taylorbacteria bacterium RIFCSPLOWO2_02_FULL_48_16]OHA45341.1 MAG: hypothetical protein A3H13_00810 [Candidatus Taylorbacteria bacterium RIFCSPLOWO2_12_FULL_48_11]
MSVCGTVASRLILEVFLERRLLQICVDRSQHIFTTLGNRIKARTPDFPGILPYVANDKSNNAPEVLIFVTSSKRAAVTEY